MNLDLGGQAQDVEIVDYRWLLKEDTVYAFWNSEFIIEDDPLTPGIDRKRKWKHLLPDAWDTNAVTYTDAPYTAKQIIDSMLEAPTVSHSWTMDSNRVLSGVVTDINAATGKEIGAVLQEILDQLGLVLAISGQTSLYVQQKGEGVIPDFPENCKTKTLGSALTGAATKVRVVGDRNVYQLSNIDLVADWATGWEQWWVEPAWLQFVEDTFGPFSEKRAGRARLAARSRTVTVREVVVAAGETYRDQGMWGEISRMEMPGWSYLQQIVWKAYRIPRAQTVNEVRLENLELSGQMLHAMKFDPGSGLHSYSDETPDKVLYPDGRGFVTVKGQPLDVYDPSRAGSFEPNMLANARNKWASNNGFQMDDKNKLIIFNDATFIPGEDDKGLFVFPNQGVTGLPEELLHIAVPNPAVEVEPASVKLTTTFKAERFSVWKGTGRNADTVHQPGLFKQICDGGKGELKYADYESADDKAEELADLVLGVEPEILSGGYERVGVSGTALIGTIDRVTVTLDFNSGLSERVDFSDEKVRGNWDSQRELERRRKSRELFPGQKEMEREAEQLRELAVQLKALDQGGSRPYYADMADTMKRTTLSRDVSPKVVFYPDIETDGVGYVKAGHTLFLDANTGAVNRTGTTFGGVVIPSQTSRRNVEVATQGTVPVLVQGPVTAGATLGCNAGENFARPNGSRLVGVARADYTGVQKVVMPVQITGSSTETECVMWTMTLVARDSEDPTAGSVLELTYPVTINGAVPSGWDTRWDFDASVANFLICSGTLSATGIASPTVALSEDPPLSPWPFKVSSIPAGSFEFVIGVWNRGVWCSGYSAPITVTPEIKWREKSAAGGLVPYDFYYGLTVQ